jgi:molybdopterin/thiamine biosynthesis adenylyltransferase
MNAENEFDHPNSDVLRLRAKKVKDPAGREVLVLEDCQASKIANGDSFKIHDLYIELLSMGIYPYRYLRNRETLSIEDQLKLAKSRVTVVGAGGLGGHVILLLARLGVGHLGIVDHDIFDETNLNRQALCSEKTLGRPKADEAAIIVRSINPGVMVTSYPVRMDSFNAEDILAGSDVVVDGLDNVPDRLVLEAATKKLGIPLVHGALAGFAGQLLTILPDDPGMNLLYGGETRDRDQSVSPEAILGVPAITASLVATLQSMEVLKLILKRGKLLRKKIVCLNLESGEIDEFPLG